MGLLQGCVGSNAAAELLGHTPGAHTASQPWGRYYLISSSTDSSENITKTIQKVSKLPGPLHDRVAHDCIDFSVHWLSILRIAHYLYFRGFTLDLKKISLLGLSPPKYHRFQMLYLHFCALPEGALLVFPSYLDCSTFSSTAA
ncbi:hypothetical protein DV515_00004552 [Chloebia gouldiae]|uniref:Uncharacterized protein n=1 Tax=Chloebia gouldiae TaxID=44316 RepID=A0A3L8SQN9_CHLGU|nr:hypothetical protein DV515_00004552 [Chloebia gouldiae]